MQGFHGQFIYNMCSSKYTLTSKGLWKSCLKLNSPSSVKQVSMLSFHNSILLWCFNHGPLMQKTLSAKESVAGRLNELCTIICPNHRNLGIKLSSHHVQKILNSYIYLSLILQQLSPCVPCKVIHNSEKILSSIDVCCFVCPLQVHMD